MAGKLYMNRLPYFWEKGFEEQRDIREGISGEIHLESIKTLLPNELQDAVARDVALQMVGYSYCNIFCMSRIDTKIVEDGALQISIPADMSQFGNKAVIITDLDEFFSRVHQAVTRCGFDYVGENVCYHQPRLFGAPVYKKSHIIWKSDVPLSSEYFLNKITYQRDVFDKSEKYQSQLEWRLALYRGVKESKEYYLDIGDITDIAKVVDFTEMIERRFIEELVMKYDHAEINHVGTISRELLRQKFVDLGEKKYWLFIDI